jgi:tripartite-type tricarboxylate transporter receptor subunit TctC
MRRWLFALFMLATLALPGSLTQAATDYPTRPIRLIVGFAPGGATDTLARLLTGELSAAVGQTVFVENLAGASGYLAWKAVADSNPDGYTLLMAENALVIRPAFKDQTPAFDPVTRLDAIAALAHSPLTLAVAKNVPADDVKQLIALSHSSDKKLNYASAGVGSVAQLVWEVVRDGTKIDAVDVPYHGGGPAMADLIAGHVDLIMASTQVAKPLVDEQMIKALAVTGKERSPALPNVPTLAEAGVHLNADVDLSFWFGVFGPKGLPPEVVAKLQTAIQKSLNAPIVRSRLADLDITPAYEPGPVLQARLGTEIKNWMDFVEAKGLTSR